MSLDSGASVSIFRNKDYFSHYLDAPSYITCANSQQLLSHGSGTVSLTPQLELNNCLYAPQAHLNLLSVSQLADNGLTTLFTQRNVIVHDSNQNIILQGQRAANGLWEITSIKKPIALSCLYSNPISKSSWMDLHRRFNHTNLGNLAKIANDINLKPSGLKTIVTDCPECVTGKMSAKPFHEHTRNASASGQILSVDICTTGITSLDGFKYFLVITDDFSKFISVKLLRSRSEASSIVIDFMTYCNTKFGRPVQMLRADNEFATNDLINFCNKFSGSALRFETPYTSQQNGAAERCIRTVSDGMRVALHQSKLPSTLWDEAVLYAADSKNCVPSSSLKTPFELWNGFKPNATFLQAFGDSAYAKLHPHERQGKPSPKAVLCTFVGYDAHHHAYRLLLPSSPYKIIIRAPQHTKFLSSFQLPPLSAGVDANNPASDAYRVTYHTNQDESDSDNEEPLHFSSQTPSTSSDSESEFNETASEGSDIDNSLPDRTKISESNIIHTRRRPLGLSAVSNPPTIPQDQPNFRLSLLSQNERLEHESIQATQLLTYEQAHASTDAQHWKVAETKELDLFKQYDVYDLVPLPPKTKMVGSRYVYTVKNGVYKARLVAQGFSQTPGIDFSTTWSPVAHFDSIRFLLSLVASRNFDLDQLDVTSAFLNAPIDIPIFMKPPPGFPNDANHAFKLKKAVYGLKQANLLWFNTITSFLYSLGLSPTKNDPCILVNGPISASTFAAVVLYVDDFLVLGSSAAVGTIKSALLKQFKMKDMGSASTYCGLEIKRTRLTNTLTVGQVSFTTSIIGQLETLLGYPLYPLSTPKNPRTKLFPCSASSSPHLLKNYQRFVGNLHHLVVGSRPDIAHATSLLAQFTQNPSPDHWDALINLYRYLKGTPNLVIQYSGTPWLLEGFSDANFGGDINNQTSISPHSYSGYIFTAANGPITWLSKKQRVTVTSTFDAEAVALLLATKKADNLVHFTQELGLVQSQICIFEDNQAVILATTQPKHALTKSINIAYHFIKESLDAKTITLKYIPSSTNPADCLTKSLFGPLLKRHRLSLGLVADEC